MLIVLATVFPLCTNGQNFSVYRKEFEKYNVVLLGEPTHGEGNVFEYKIKLIQYLHDSLGYNTIAFESGFIDLYFANRFIKQYPDSNSKNYLTQAIFPIWTQAKEFQPFFEYFEKTKKKLDIIGFDPQLTGVYGREFFLDTIISIIEQRKPMGVLKLNTDLLRQCITSFETLYSFPDGVRYEKYLKQTNLLRRYLKKVISKKEERWFFIQAVNSLIALGADYYNKKDKHLNEQNFLAQDSNPRDSMMAENLCAYIKQNPNKKIICWGAAPHFMNETKSIQNEELKAFNPMGMLLKRKIAPKMACNVTFISSKGTHGLIGTKPIEVPQPKFGNIEYDLQRYSHDSLIFLNTTNVTHTSFTSSCVEYTPLIANWSRAFDIFVYMPSFTPAHLIEADSNEEKQIGTPIKKDFLSNQVFSRKIGQRNSLHSMNYLDEVTIMSKKQTVTDILDSVKKHWDENYINSPYAQIGYNSLRITNNDSNIFDFEGISDYFAYLPSNSQETMNVNCQEVNSHKYSGNNRDLILQAGGTPLSGNAIEPDVAFIEKSLRNFDFSINSVYYDTIWGNVIAIKYHQKHMNRWLTNTWLIEENNGEIFIRVNDYAIIKSVKYIKRDLDHLNKWSIKNGSKKRAKLPIMDAINIKEEKATETKNYYYDTIANKYVVRNYESIWERKGVFNDNLDRSFSTVAINTLYTKKASITVEKNQSFRIKKLMWYQQKNNPDYWKAFSLSQFIKQ
ncbi:MAG: erythromycin esterase family protein [Bacteroidetes bacterium]|nr:erythromycin esterase family protein [Bacteroidota bacterium]MBS1739187.1 erythromycin esterase family protein [Bacteroidota bacterium]